MGRCVAATRALSRDTSLAHQQEDVDPKDEEKEDGDSVALAASRHSPLLPHSLR